MAAIRLLLPFNVESQFSLQPNYGNFEGLIAEQQYQPDVSVPDIPNVEQEPETPPQDIPIDSENPTPLPETLPRSFDCVQLLSTIWVVIMAGMVAYCVVSYIILKYRIRTAIRCEKGVLESEHISGAFLLGYLKPRVYLPVGLSEQDRAFILAHERTHIQRLDHWWKLIGIIKEPRALVVQP